MSEKKLDCYDCSNMTGGECDFGRPLIKCKDFDWKNAPEGVKVNVIDTDSIQSFADADVTPSQPSESSTPSESPSPIESGGGDFGGGGSSGDFGGGGSD